MVPTSHEFPASEPDREDALEVLLENEESITTATMFARELCNLVQLRGYAGQKVVTAVRELARHVLVHAGRGSVRMYMSEDGDRVVCVSEDRGAELGELRKLVVDARRWRGLATAARLSDTIELRREGERNLVELSFRV